MYTIDIDTLAVLQRERYNDFVRQAELLRLVREQQEPGNPAQPVARTNVLTALQQMVWTVLQTHVRAVRPH